MIDPIDNIKWLPAQELHSNWWNPNVVFEPELKLLEESILEQGWTQAILINTSSMIIDGFHRWQLSITSRKLQSRYAEEVPCAILDLDDREAMMLTVRMNRAKGTHSATRMSDLVKKLVEDYGVTTKEMMLKMGMTKSEVELLQDGSLLKHKNLDTYRFSKAWIPVETKHLSAEERKKYEK